MNREFIITADGSHSLYVKDLDEHYHSVHGAIREAQHVFLKAGIQHLVSADYKEISILEIGFGTGLNTLLSFLEAAKQNVNIKYTSLEAFPLTAEITDQLNYVKLIAEIEKGNEKEIDAAFKKIHTSEWGKRFELSQHFSLLKIEDTLQNINFKEKFDLIFFDAFGPRVQPEMWTEELFKKIFEAMNHKGCLVTYCAKGEVKRTLKRAGFEVETLPGPPGKREMVRGRKGI